MTIDAIHTGPLGVNTYIVSLGGPAVFIVDPAACAFSGDEYTITRYLEEKKLTPVAIVLTHGHFDHVAGLPQLRKCYGESLPILIHKADAPFIGANSESLQSQSLSAMRFEEFIPSVTNLPEPDYFLCEGKTLADYLCGGKNNKGNSAIDECIKSDDCVKNALKGWTVLHTPGHSPGSVCLYNKDERTLISGDTLFYHAYGRTDLPGGDEYTIQKSLRRLLKEIPQNTLIYPGHDAYGFVAR